MFPSPANIEEFDRLVPDENAAEELFVRVRWPDGVVCPRCGSRELTRLETRKLWQCKACRHQPSARSGTALHRTRTPLRDIFYAVWRACGPGTASTRAVARELGYRYETIFHLLHKMRAALAERGAWQLEASPVHVGAAELPTPKRAKGPGSSQPVTVVALAVEQEPVAPAVSAVRFATPDGREADHELAARAREEHVAPTAKVALEPERMGFFRKRGSRFLEEELRCVRVWLTLTFVGVSSRYLANYLAQYAYRSNRWHLRRGFFGWVLRRLASEPWRPTAEVALAAP